MKLALFVHKTSGEVFFTTEEGMKTGPMATTLRWEFKGYVDLPLEDREGFHIDKKGNRL